MTVSSDLEPSRPLDPAGRSGARLAGIAPIERRPSRTREALDVLRSAIVSGELAPGSLHSVTELAELLEVSRTPVREALIELASRGMVRFERNRGVRVIRTSIRDIEEIFDIRLLLEVPAAFRAVSRMGPAEVRGLRKRLQAMKRAAAAGDEEGLWSDDRGFHHELLAASANRRLADYVDTLRDMVLVRGVTTAGRTRSLDDIVAEHQAILDHVEAGDAAAAAGALRAHIEHTAELLVAQEQGLLEPA